MRKITVSIGYYEFTFKSLKDAEDFADTAARASEKDCTVRLEMTYTEDEEENDEV